MRQPLNGDSASPQSLSDSNCYQLGPLFCPLSASVSPNHVSIQKPKCHLCVCVTAITIPEFCRATNKTNERESPLWLLWFYYCSFMRFSLLMARWASRSLCVCVILAVSSIKIQPVRIWKNGWIPPVHHGEGEVIAFLSHIQMSVSSGEHEEFE